MSRSDLKLTFVHAGKLYPFQSGGPGVVARNLLEQFDKRDVSVDFLLIWNGPQLTASQLGYSPNIRVKTIKEKWNFFSPISGYLTPGDIVHFNSQSYWLPHVFFSSICSLRRKHVIATIHGYPSLEFRYNKIGWSKASIIQAEQQLVYPRDAKIVVFSHYMKRLVSRQLLINPDRIVVFPLGVDLKKFDKIPSRSHKELTITFVGRLTRIKGVETLLRALNILQHDFDFQANIVGDGPLRRSLEELALKLGLESTVHFLGELEHSKIATHLWHTDVIAVPSMHECACTLVILEAFAAKVPIVASNVGGIPELVRNNETGLLVSPNDPAALASALKQVILDKVLRRRLIDNARRSVADHDWSVVVEQYLSLYESSISVDRKS